MLRFVAFVTMISMLYRQRVNSWIVTTASLRRHKLHFFSIKVANDSDSIYQELKSLSQELLKHDDLYYNIAHPILSDEEYDALAAREAQLCSDYPSLVERLKNEGLSTRFGGRVGVGSHSIQERFKRAHLVPMLSLDNIHAKDEL